jgi:HEAT repeat protein
MNRESKWQITAPIVTRRILLCVLIALSAGTIHERAFPAPPPPGQQPQQSIEEIIQQLNSSDRKDRLRAAVRLGETKDTRAVEPLINSFQHDGYSAVRESAARSLGKLKDPRAVAPLVAALAADNKDPFGVFDVKAAIVYALGEIADSKSIEALTKLLDSPDPELKKRVAEVLASIKDRALAKGAGAQPVPPPAPKPAL